MDRQMVEWGSSVPESGAITPWHIRNCTALVRVPNSNAIADFSDSPAADTVSAPLSADLAQHSLASAAADPDARTFTHAVQLRTGP